MPRPIFQKYVAPIRAEDYPIGTVAESGVLLSGSADWRRERPVFNADLCTGCLKCYLACPDGAVVREGKKVVLDERFCKGCGICAVECRLKAIRMAAERE